MHCIVTYAAHCTHVFLDDDHLCTHYFVFAANTCSVTVRIAHWVSGVGANTLQQLPDPLLCAVCVRLAKPTLGLLVSLQEAGL